MCAVFGVRGCVCVSNERVCGGERERAFVSPNRPSLVSVSSASTPSHLNCPLHPLPHTHHHQHDRYTLVASKKAMEQAQLYSRDDDSVARDVGVDPSRVGVVVGSGMGGLQVFQDGVTTINTKGERWRVTCVCVRVSVCLSVCLSV